MHEPNTLSILKILTSQFGTGTLQKYSISNISDAQKRLQNRSLTKFAVPGLCLPARGVCDGDESHQQHQVAKEEHQMLLRLSHVDLKMM